MYKNRKVKAVILARMTSSRLRDKMLLPFGRSTVVETVIDRTRHCRTIDSIVLATSTHPADDVFEDIARKTGLRLVRGSENDVVSRMLDAAGADEEGVIVRICSDNPLFMPSAVDMAVADLVDTAADVITPAEFGTYPFGYSMVVLDRGCLNRINSEASDDMYREHVENFCFDNPGMFDVRYQTSPEAEHFPELCLTLDYPEDYERLRLCEKAMREVHIDKQAPVLVEWVRNCEVGLLVENQERGRDLKAMIERYSAGKAVLYDLTRQDTQTILSKLEENEHDLIIGVDLIPGLDPGIAERGMCVIDPDSRKPRRLLYMGKGIKPYIVYSQEIAGVDDEDCLLYCLPHVIKRIMPGYPPSEGRHETFFPASAKCSSAGSRPGFSSPSAVRFPPMLVVIPATRGDGDRGVKSPIDMIISELQHREFENIYISDAGGMDIEICIKLESRFGKKVVRGNAPELPLSASIFQLLIIGSDGSIQYGIDETGGSTGIGDIRDISIAEAWQSVTLQRVRNQIMNGLHHI